MQRGRIFRKGPSWFLQFRRAEFREGKPVQVQAIVRLAQFSDTYRSKRDVESLAAPHLSAVNTNDSADLGLTLNEYMEKHFFPAAATRLRPSSLKGYKDIHRVHIKNSIGAVRLRDFKTSTAQTLLDSLSGFSHQTLLHVRNVLSGVFSHARRTDLWTGVNPLVSVRVGGKKTRPDRHAYTLDVVIDMLAKLPEPARSVVAVAAFTGLRESEIRGLRWSDFDGSVLNVQRSVWRTHVGETKTADSAASVPVIPALVKILKKHRKRFPGEPHGYIFAGQRRGFSLNLDNLSRRIIIPAVGGAWHGWHAFRRGLASNLNRLGVDGKTIQELLRHGSMGVTMKHYVVIDRSETANAMKKVERLLARKEKSKKRNVIQK
jgi:integrase